MNNLQNNLPILWRGDLQIAPRDTAFPSGLKTRWAQNQVNISLEHNTVDFTFCLTHCQQKTSNYGKIIPPRKTFKHRLLQQSKFQQSVSTAKLTEFKKLFPFVKVMKPQNAKKVRNNCNLYNSGLSLLSPCFMLSARMHRSGSDPPQAGRNSTFVAGRAQRSDSWHSPCSFELSYSSKERTAILPGRKRG